MDISPQAVEANRILEDKAPQIYDLLSEDGKKAFFPKSGILAQAAEAKDSRINATIGSALDDKGKPLSIRSILVNSRLSPRETVMYSPSYGQKKLREKWLERIRDRNPSLEEEKTSLPVVTNAITHGLSITGRLFVNDMESIIVPDMIWGNYKLIFQHAKLDQYPLFDKGRFNVKGLREKLKKSSGKQVVLLNFPNNPTGYSATEQDSDAIVDAIEQSAEAGNRLVVLCDDAYFGLFYEDDVFKESIFARLAGLNSNVLAVKLDGITKELFSWGLRVGFVTYASKDMADEAAAVLEDKTSGAVRGNVSNICTHSQFLALRALEYQPALERQEKKNFGILKERYEEVKKIVSDGKYRNSFEALPFNSGYFMCVRLKQGDCEAVRKRLLDEFDCGVIAQGDILRIAFSSVPKSSLREVFDSIHKACNV